ncbi:F0F1 ATP synthase subunit A [Dehalobacter sp. DCM]|uniref:F0F1 ATP synthase subunit A n=1 Tax=Dehalobacter sp. DCM TaxID=2907827 RepID=UPI0030818A09|nr:F0F1 ATP synthase subunit A [Dehalobacter sp. DCM]
MHETVLWHVGNFTLHGKTLVMTWMAIALLLIFVFFGIRNLTSGKPGKIQNVLEFIVDFVKSLISDNMDYKKGVVILPYLLTLILFVFFSNMLGLIPNIAAPIFKNVEFAQLNHILGGATLMSPTADINTTMGLALLTIILVVYFGIKYKGAHYFHHFVEPFPFMLPIHVVDFLSKPLTLAFRLFGNIFAGEVLISVILMLPGFMVLGGIVPMPIWLGFSMFIGAVQSFVITVLTIAYIAQAVNVDH